MGQHLMLDFSNIREDVDLNNVDLLDTKIREIVQATSVTVEGQMFKKFVPQGCTLLYLLSESHISIHTWPEYRACTIDFYHCGPNCKENLAIAEQMFMKFFGRQSCSSHINFSRGSTHNVMVNDFQSKVEILKNVCLIHEESSQYQKIQVYDSPLMGRILVLDGAI